MDRRCFQCEQDNPPGQRFCGNCGAALTLREFISRQVTEGVASAVRDRDILETESSIRVFERAWGWATKIGGIASAIVAAIIVFVGFKAYDLRTTTEKAKQTVADTADTTRKSIDATSAQSVHEIRAASKEAIDANQVSAANAKQLSSDLKVTAAHTKSELSGEASSVRQEVATSQVQLDEVKKLQPEFDVMRGQLGKATTELAAQQKVISSSEDFVKHVFSSHVTYMFSFPSFVQPKAVIIPAPSGAKNSTVYMLLPVTPMDGTIQLQYKIFLQPPNSYFHVHNLIVFFWGDPPDNLKQDTLSISLFPDTSDKETIKALTVQDGRVFADGEPLPKFNVPDPDFKGSKWFPRAKPETPR
jgi:hypothetical protein